MFAILIDPDAQSPDAAAKRCITALELGVDAILVGGSRVQLGSMFLTVLRIHEAAGVSPVLFPGANHPCETLVRGADGYLCPRIMGVREPRWLSGWYREAKRISMRRQLAPLQTSYILVASGGRTTVTDVLQAKPIARDNCNGVASLAAVGQARGHVLTYLEAGSGARLSVPDDMVAAVHAATDVPLIVGGGLRTPDDVGRKIKNGADVIVVGNVFERKFDPVLLKDMLTATRQP